VAEKAGVKTDSAFKVFLDRGKSIFSKTFYNPKTGILGGLRNKDGELHDYWFTFVNSMAIAFGFIDKLEARKIM